MTGPAAGRNVLTAYSVDTVGVHYSATIWRWYRNWIGNADTIKAKYGERWFRVSHAIKIAPTPVIQSR
jgi:hypothetical protein